MHEPTGRQDQNIARETSAGGNSSVPVGTLDQVARTILTYIDVGAATILIRGYEPLRCDRVRL